MILALLAVGLMLLALPGAVPEPPRRLPPREWTAVAIVAMFAGVVAVLAGLVLAAIPAVAAALGIPGVADHCRGALAPLATEPTFVNWAAAGLAVVLTARMCRAIGRSWRVARRARVEPWLGDHRPQDGFDLVTVPADVLLAFGVPGRTPQVVISTGLTERLARDEVDAVVGHEAAHLRLRHPAVLAFLHGFDVAFSGCPFVARSVRRLRAALEISADAAVDGQGSAHRRSLRAALVGAIDACGDGRVSAEARHRITRLSRRTSPRPFVLRAAVYAPVAILVLAVAVTAVGWFTQAHHAVALGGPCNH